MKLKKKILSIALSAALGVTMCAPMTAFAAESSTTAFAAPSQAMTVDNNVVKVGIHAAASTTAFFLGGNVVAERASDYASITGEKTPQAQLDAAMKFTRLGAFGSSSNVSPDPYLWNYFYNLAVAAGKASGPAATDAVYLSSVGSPMASDTTVVDSLGTSYTLDRRPDVLMDTAGGYADLIAQINASGTKEGDATYNPISIDYAANNFQDLVNDMYNLADAIKASGKKTRYEDPKLIAEKYEAYMKGIQYYIISQINAGKVAKKKVAVVDIVNAADTNNDGANDTFQLVDNTVSIGTSTDRPSESIMYISDNIYTDSSVQKTSYEVETTSRGQTVKSTVQGASAKDIAAYADVIIQAGHTTATEAQIRDAFKAAGADLGDKPVYATDPSDVFSIRANSVENFAGVGIFGGYLYPELINPIHATMYIYENFWHLNQADLVNFANANFADASLPAGIARSGAGYDAAAIQGIIDAGMKYYSDNNKDFAGTTLEVTDELAADQGIQKSSLQNITIDTATKTVKYKKVKKAAQTLGAVKVTGNVGKVTFKKAGGSAKLTIAKNGKIKVKKGTKKGTYKIKVKATAAKSGNYLAASSTATIKVKVK